MTLYALSMASSVHVIRHGEVENPKNILYGRQPGWRLSERGQEMAKVLAARGYHYQFVFAPNAGHVDHAVEQQTLPEALEYLWQGYTIAGTKH